MNPILIILIFIGAIILWLLLAGVFGFVGKISYKIFDDAKNAMFEEEKDDNEKED